MASSTDSQQEVAATLREEGRRATAQRLGLHGLLRERDCQASAEELLERGRERLPGLSLPRLYATLALLVELGLARRVAVGEGPALYDPRTEEHQHFVCRACGTVSDLDARANAAPAVRAARSAGFRPEGAEVIVHGLCAACAGHGRRS